MKTLSQAQLLASAQVIKSYSAAQSTSQAKRLKIMDTPFPNGVVAVGSLLELVRMRDYIAFTLSVASDKIEKVFFLEPCRILNDDSSKSKSFTYRLCCRING